MVPNDRLLVWSALTLLPFGTLAAAVPEWQLIAALLVFAFLLFVVLDAVLAMDLLRDFQTEMAPVVRLAKNRDDVFEFSILNQAGRSGQLRVALPLPLEAFEAGTEQCAVNVHADDERVRLNWPCKPRKRGRYVLERCYVEMASRFGFWLRRADLAMSSELRVYPNLEQERKHVAAFFLRRGHMGIHAQRQVGKGRDFEKLREYIPGDPMDDIHWKATAKRNRPITKIFQVERTQELYVVVDGSRLTCRRLHGEAETIIEKYLTATLMMGLATERLGDLFGVITFNDKVQQFVRARNGTAHYNVCRNAIYQFDGQPVSPDFDELATFIRVRLPRRALLVYLTCLDDPVLAEQFVSSMQLLHKQHLVLANVLTPAQSRELFGKHPVSSIDDVYGELGAHLSWQQLNDVKVRLHRMGIGLNHLDDVRFCQQLISQYMSVKSRQLL